MLALERTRAAWEIRLDELRGRLDIAQQGSAERLLLRIETWPLRQEAFLEAFQAVGWPFSARSSAGLSEGEGHLQLEKSRQPLEGGSPWWPIQGEKGGAAAGLDVGGKKSLTALSFHCSPCSVFRPFSLFMPSTK